MVETPDSTMIENSNRQNGTPEIKYNADENLGVLFGNLRRGLEINRTAQVDLNNEDFSNLVPKVDDWLRTHNKPLPVEINSANVQFLKDESGKPYAKAELGVEGKVAKYLPKVRLNASVTIENSEISGRVNVTKLEAGIFSKYAEGFITGPKFDETLRDFVLSGLGEGYEDIIIDLNIEKDEKFRISLMRSPSATKATLTPALSETEIPKITPDEALPTTHEPILEPEEEKIEPGYSRSYQIVQKIDGKLEGYFRVDWDGEAISVNRYDDAGKWEGSISGFVTEPGEIKDFIREQVFYDEKIDDSPTDKILDIPEEEPEEEEASEKETIESSDEGFFIMLKANQLYKKKVNELEELINKPKKGITADELGLLVGELNRVKEVGVDAFLEEARQKLAEEKTTEAEASVEPKPKEVSLSGEMEKYKEIESRIREIRSVIGPDRWLTAEEQNEIDKLNSEKEDIEDIFEARFGIYEKGLFYQAFGDLNAENIDPNNYDEYLAAHYSLGETKRDLVLLGKNYFAHEEEVTEENIKDFYGKAAKLVISYGKEVKMSEEDFLRDFLQDRIELEEVQKLADEITAGEPEKQNIPEIEINDEKTRVWKIAKKNLLERIRKAKKTGDRDDVGRAAKTIPALKESYQRIENIGPEVFWGELEEQWLQSLYTLADYATNQDRSPEERDKAREAFDKLKQEGPSGVLGVFLQEARDNLEKAKAGEILDSEVIPLQIDITSHREKVGEVNNGGFLHVDNRPLEVIYAERIFNERVESLQQTIDQFPRIGGTQQADELGLLIGKLNKIKTGGPQAFLEEARKSLEVNVGEHFLSKEVKPQDIRQDAKRMALLQTEKDGKKIYLLTHWNGNEQFVEEYDSDWQLQDVDSRIAVNPMQAGKRYAELVGKYKKDRKDKNEKFETLSLEIIPQEVIENAERVNEILDKKREERREYWKRKNAEPLRKLVYELDDEIKKAEREEVEDQEEKNIVVGDMQDQLRHIRENMEGSLYEYNLALKREMEHKENPRKSGEVWTFHSDFEKTQKLNRQIDLAFNDAEPALRNINDYLETKIRDLNVKTDDPDYNEFINLGKKVYEVYSQGANEKETKFDALNHMQEYAQVIDDRFKVFRRLKEKYARKARLSKQGEKLASEVQESFSQPKETEQKQSQVSLQENVSSPVASVKEIVQSEPERVKDFVVLEERPSAQKYRALEVRRFNKDGSLDKSYKLLFWTTDGVDAYAERVDEIGKKFKNSTTYSGHIGPEKQYSTFDETVEFFRNKYKAGENIESTELNVKLEKDVPEVKNGKSKEVSRLEQGIIDLLDLNERMNQEIKVDETSWKKLSALNEKDIVIVSDPKKDLELQYLLLNMDIEDIYKQIGSIAKLDELKLAGSLLKSKLEQRKRIFDQLKSKQQDLQAQPVS